MSTPICRPTDSTPERRDTVTVVTTAFKSVLSRNTAYVSTPITSGIALYEAAKRHGVSEKAPQSPCLQACGYKAWRWQMDWQREQPYEFGARARRKPVQAAPAQAPRSTGASTHSPICWSTTTHACWTNSIRRSSLSKLPGLRAQKPQDVHLWRTREPMPDTIAYQQLVSQLASLAHAAAAEN